MRIDTTAEANLVSGMKWLQGTYTPYPLFPSTLPRPQRARLKALEGRNKIAQGAPPMAAWADGSPG